MSTFRKILTVLSVSLVLAVSVPNVSLANESGTATGDDVAIILDVFVLRPIGLVSTLVGTVLFVPALVFALPSQSVGKTFNALIVSPAKYTFVRELGGDSRGENY